MPTKKRPPAKTRSRSPMEANGKFARENQQLRRERDEGAEQQAATSEILRLIASAPGNIEAVLSKVAECAARLCAATDAQIFRVENNFVHRVGAYGDLPVALEVTPYNRESPAGRAMIDRQRIHIPDLAAVVEREFPVVKEYQQYIGHRTTLAVPLLRDGHSLGAILIRRLEVRPFTDSQIKLLETFADQATIAIENARLIQERETRNRDLAALFDVTATASQSLEIKPVLDEVVKKITDIFSFDAVGIFLFDPQGEFLNLAAYFSSHDEFGPMRRVFERGQGLTGRVAETGEPIIFENVNTDPRYQELSYTRSTQQREYCFFGIFPIKAKVKFAGTIQCLGKLPRKLIPEEVRLINAMCDQIGVAVENINLFDEVRNKTKELENTNSELREALEQKTATSEILRVIASSPTDIQPVLDTVAENAARLCEADDAQILRVDGDVLRRAASYGSRQSADTRPCTRETVAGRAVIDRETVHIHDLRATEDHGYRRLGFGYGESRTLLGVPLLREGVAIGVILIRRFQVRPFLESQITLLKTFADQAVIAIENVRLFQELKESLEQQTATSEILGVIASSPTDIQPVLEAVVENAARLCDAKDASIFRVDGDMLDRAAAYGPMPGTDIRRSIGRGSVPGRAVIDKQTIHVRDILEAEAEKEFPDTGRRAQQFTGTRTILSTPLLREGVSIGTISVRRQEVRPFTDKQITLIEIFASQAVIAIENVRLFKELQERNRDLTEALEQQTATSEVLSVISSSPTDVQPVFDTIVKNATRLCEASFGSAHRFDNQLITLDAQYGMTTEQIELGQRQFPTPATRGKAVGRAILSREVIHIEDIGDDPEYEFVEVHTELSFRTVLAVPLIKDGTPIGALGMWRREVKPFTESQINLVKTFADQAVIAIENLRLFQELKESLEQQTATSEILGVIASSPTDIQPVLDVVAENAARLCDATDAVIHRIDGDNLRPVANYGPLPGRGDRESIPIDREHIPARAIIDRRTLHIDDLATVPMVDLAARFARSVGVRTVLATPLLREGIPIGSIHIRRLEVRAFTERQIKLLETFAAQAVIAIENVRLFQELKESLDQQTATSEILGVIASSPTDIQPVLDTVAATAARLCEAIDVMVLRVEGDVLRLVAHYGPIAAGDVALHRGTLGGRTVIERRLFHIRDLQAEVDEFPEGSALARERGHRTTLSVPLIRENVAIGNIQVRRDEVRPFSDQHISLLQTFADQAVIAIENVRLFKELETRNRQLTEALEQQTATSEVLRVIASSPTDLQPVLDAVAASAARLCDAIDARIMRIDGDQFHTAAHFGEMPEPGVEEPRFTISRDRPSGRAVIDRQTIHLHDLATAVEHEYPGVREYQRRFGARTVLVTPLMREGTPLGVIHIRRTEVRPFTDSQIKLLETFAAQAVIAIENVRLFNELDERNRQLTEALEQQTATSEVLRVIASSPTELQPVLDTLIANAVKLSGATQGHIRQYDGELLRPVAHYGESPEQVALLQETARKPTSEYTTGRAFLERKPVHVLDAQLEQPRPGIFVALRSWARTMLAVPLLREGTPIGVITIWRDFVEGFTERQIDLVQTFADQAVIAIENVRLFKELQERNRDLTEALEQQTATSEILRVIASSPTDLQPVFDAIVGSAARLCEATFAALHRFDGQMVKFDACYGMTEFEIEETRTRFPLPATREIAVGRAILDRRIAHIDDIRSDPEYRVTSGQMSFRTVLAVPLLREGNAVGALGLWRREVQPFTDKQMALVKTFADQAVIAIENVRLFQELKESLEQQTATSEILGVIASSPTDIQPVLDTVAENAARLCDADDAIIYRELGEHAQLAARYGSIPVTAESLPISRRFVGGRAMIDRQTIHVLDVVAEIDTEYPDAKSMNQVSGVRTVLATPLIRQGEPIGSIVIRRTEVRPFTEKQIKLLETFADQSVIAIENVRLFNELDTRNRQLTEALEQQTATSEILRVIASSPTDIQPVLDVVAENAASLCEATDVNIYRLEGSEYRIVAARGNMPIPRREEARPLIRGLPPGRAMIDREVIHIHDMSRPEAQAEYPEAWAMIKSFGFRTALAVPLLREGTAIGAILIRRNEVRPFSDKQIALLKTFADQAVIAIENVRLFQELQQRTRELVESVEEMKALSEVGQTVSSSLDLATVLETIVARAVDLVGTDSGVIYEFDEAGQEFHLRASHHMEAEAVEALRAARIRLGEGATGQAALTRAPVQIPDTFEEREGSISRVRPVLNRLGYRSLVTVPILREQQIMGGLTVWRRQAGEFEPEVVNLLQTFATQSALAIHNARLFREIEAKSAQLEVASRHKSEFLANMSHELRTPLNAIIGFSEVLLEKMFGELNDKQNEYVDDILSSGRHLLSLINDILDLSKIEAGRMDLEVTTFYLPDAIENALLLIRERANRHGIKLDRSIDERLGDFTGDERKVKQVLVNLLSNAVKFTPEGGQIKVEAGLGDHAAIISVTDTGIGIAKQDQEAIFEEFRQASGSYAHKREGTGLGLTLTRKFVEMHGGTIWVESDIGKGSTFTFTLPISLRSEG